MSFCPTKIPFGIFIIPKRILPYGVNSKTSQLVFYGGFREIEWQTKINHGEKN